MNELLQIGQAFGLAVPAGLNAYIPLLVVGIAANLKLIELNDPYTILADPWAILIIVVLLAIEFFADKITGVDHINDILQTVVRPAAGAILFAANSGVIGEMHPWLALGAGLVLAGGTHGVKATARPLITATTGGTMNPVVSTVEDVAALVVAVLAIAVPILAVGLILVGAVGVLAGVLWLRQRRRDASVCPKYGFRNRVAAAFCRSCGEQL